MRILVVDDDYVSRVKLKALLAPYGDCDAVPDGELAIKMIAKAHEEEFLYALVTMDIDMPGMPGQDVVLQIRSWERSMKLDGTEAEAKILMITSMADAENMVSSFQEGCQWYLVKPVTEAKLRSTLASGGFLTDAMVETARGG